MSDDASTYATRADWHMRSDIENAPLGKKIFVINEGGVLIQEILNSETRKLYREWSELPKRAKK